MASPASTPEELELKLLASSGAAASASGDRIDEAMMLLPPSLARLLPPILFRPIVAASRLSDEDEEVVTDGAEMLGE